MTHRSVLTRRWTECKISKEGFGKLVAGLPKDCSFLMIWWALLQYVTGRNTVDRIKYRTCISMYTMSVLTAGDLFGLKCCLLFEYF